MTDILIDTHVHVAIEDCEKYPRAEAPPFETPDYVNPAESFLRRMDEAGVTYATIVQPFGLYGSDNSYHADSAAAHPGRLRAVCGLSPSPTAPDDLRRWVKARGMSALRLNTRGEKGGLLNPHVAPMLEEASALRVPVTIMMSHRHIESARKLAEQFPRVPLALDHLGGAKPEVEDSFTRLEELAATDNIHLKVSTNQIIAPGGVERISRLLRVFGANRIMWGTNYPVTDLGGYSETVRAAIHALVGLAPAERAGLMGRAALGLWPDLKPA